MMSVKQWLKRAWRIDDRIERRIEEKERLRAKLTGRTAHLTGMPRGGGADAENAVLAVIELERQIDEEIFALCRVKREINDAINAVESVKCRDLLEMRYRNYWTWERIRQEMGYSDVRAVYYLHKRALRMIKII